MFKLLILDVDGVLTDGTKIYGLDGAVIAKRFCDQDFTAIKRFRAINIPTMWLSGDEKVNRGIAEYRHIDFIYTKWEDPTSRKELFLPSIRDKYNVEYSDMAYVGDDIYDVAIMELVGYRYCPLDAAQEVKAISTIIDRNGGDKVIAKLYRNLQTAGLVP